MKKWPTTFRELLRQERESYTCEYAYIEIESLKTDDGKPLRDGLDVYIFESLPTGLDESAYKQIARAYVDRMIDLHPEWVERKNFMFMHYRVVFGNGLSDTSCSVYVDYRKCN